MSDSELAKSFDNVAENYDKYRTGYPQELILDIFKIAKINPKSCFALEIGCGTGQATLDFANAGASILCVEPGAKLVDRAKTNLVNFKNVSFAASTYENLDTNGKKFNLIYAAQSFHWVDNKQVYNLLQKDLLPNGLFAAFWKRSRPKNDVLTNLLNSLFATHFPDFAPQSHQDYETDILGDLNNLVKSGKFYGCQLRRYPCPSETLNALEYSNGLSTWSKVAALPLEKRIGLLKKIEDIVAQHGGLITNENQEITLICGFCREIER